MPSFDIVCELDQVNLRHVVENTQREISNRFDFKGISATAELKEKTLTLTTEGSISIVDLFAILYYTLNYILFDGDDNANRDSIYCSML